VTRILEEQHAIFATLPCTAPRVQTIVLGTRRATVGADALGMDASVMGNSMGCFARSVPTALLPKTAKVRAHGTTVAMAGAMEMARASVMTAGSALCVIRALLDSLEVSARTVALRRLTVVDMVFADRMVNASAIQPLVVLLASHALQHTDLQVVTCNALPRRHAMGREGVRLMVHVCVSPASIVVGCEILWRRRCLSQTARTMPRSFQST